MQKSLICHSLSFDKHIHLCDQIPVKVRDIITTQKVPHVPLRPGPALPPGAPGVPTLWAGAASGFMDTDSLQHALCVRLT